MAKSIYILGIESSCDDTAAAVIKDTEILTNIIASQKVHEEYGGVVPELASRAHQQHIVPVVDKAIKDAGITKEELSAVAVTSGPGLLGSLMVGSSFAKAFALGLDIPLITVNHLQAHIYAHFIKEANIQEQVPSFPFLTLLVSGGNSQLVLMKDHFEMEIIGKTIDDAAGEAFDKCAKVMGMPYPGGPLIDKLAKDGNPEAFQFSKPRIADLDYSFSGLKTSFLYFLRDQIKENPNFIEENKKDLCASLQRTIVEILMDKLIKAVNRTGVKHVAIAGGVSANSALQRALQDAHKKYGWQIYIPKLGYSLDNAAMVAVTGYYKYLKQDFATQDFVPYAKVTV
ncbi:O-sialoglycoprotein endopeptidase [Balneicella halophila]|uniref:tRNA N6-adenosine threonylcarbamoyltransferase n=1 Tax=Balneicella halophila TaxID=1537566 RepID=A0A7L4UMC4_BALHA|nr:tRNA (adenosine(37)-N6)-threonylcarbamoyltransferase complex transferase subunit TsaD [Balneicella halophila]PVX49381.1 O-sialoglycoprotein endopeptidase [Balneicella halophila]